MKRIFAAIGMGLLIGSAGMSAQTAEYLSPAPGSTAASTETRIIVRSSARVTAAPERMSRHITLKGDGTTAIECTIVLGRDGRTINVVPLEPLKPSTRYVVAIKGNRDVGLPDTSYSFRTAQPAAPGRPDVLPVVQEGEEVPTDVVPLTVTVNTTPAPGYLYISPFCRTPKPVYAPYLMILDNAGNLKHWKSIPEYAFDFRPLPDGRLGYTVFQMAASGARAFSQAFQLDSNLDIIRELKPSNGYQLAQHAFTVLPNGNRVLLSQEDVVMDLSDVVPGGDPAATVTQPIVQEVDPNGVVLFQWRSLDYFPVTASYEPLNAATIRYSHNNALEIDTDGNFLLSLRHMSTVIKVNRSTGEIMWILGGKLNQFRFIGEDEANAPNYFSYQHDIRRLPNGNISMFDNGNQKNPPHTRAVEYTIDEQTKTCTLAWSYRHVPDIYAQAQGAVQTLPNGHRIIAWGNAVQNGSPAITEVDAAGTVVFEATLPTTMHPYKVEKLPYPMGRPASKVFIDEVLRGNTYTYTRGTDTIGLTITWNVLESFFYNATVAYRYPYAPEDPVFEGTAPTIFPVRVTVEQEGITSHEAEFRFKASVLGLERVADRITVFHRDTIGKGLFTALKTRYNPASQEIVVDTAQVGEFTFGLVNTSGRPSVPALLSPRSDAKVLANAETRLRISPKGNFLTHTIEVSTRQDMSNVIFRSTSNNDKARTTPLSAGRYYWRARSISDTDQPGDWTAVDSFLVTDAYTKLVAPDNNVVWYQDSAYVIKWETNVSTRIRLELMNGETVVALIRDSVASANKGLLWKVPVSVPAGKDYRVRITLLDETFGTMDVSLGTVEIRQITTSVQEKDRGAGIMIIPNPSRNSFFIGGIENITEVSFFTNDGSHVRTDEVMGTGAQFNVSDLASGMYQLVIRTGSNAYTKPLVISR